MNPYKLKELARLGRLEYLGFGCVAVIGALSAVGAELTLAAGLTIFAVNMLAIVWGFVHNDLCDQGYDTRSGVHRDRPLVKGSVSRTEAAAVMGVCLAAALGLAALLTRGWLPLLVLAASSALAALYNRWSKKRAGADLLYAASAALLCLFGALAAGGGTDGRTALGWLSVVVVAIEAVDHLFFNIAGALKDLESDRRAGVPTIPVLLGLRVNPDRCLIVPLRFSVLCMTLKAMTIGLIFAPFALLDLPFHPLQLVLMAAVALLALGGTLQILRLKVFDRSALAHRIVRQESAVKALVPLMLFSHIGLGWTLFFLVAPVWFVIGNSLLNEHPGAPPKTF